MKLTFALLVCFAMGQVWADVHLPDYGSLTGKIQGRPWTFVSGRAQKSKFFPGKLELAFWDKMESSDCNDYTLGSDRQVVGIMLHKLGKQAFSNVNNFTFYLPTNQNLVVLHGQFELTKIKNKMAYGKLAIKFDAKNYVSGDFAVPLCE